MLLEQVAGGRDHDRDLPADEICECRGRPAVADVAQIEPGGSRPVWPGGAAALTACTPMRPGAPERFSTMTGRSRATRKFSAISRASASPEPPAANGKTMRVGSLPVCARAPEACPAIVA